MLEPEATASERHAERMRELAGLLDVDTIAAQSAFGSRFGLATIVRQRAEQVHAAQRDERFARNAQGFVDTPEHRDEKPVTVALEEAASGQLQPLAPPVDVVIRPRYTPELPRVDVGDVPKHLRKQPAPAGPNAGVGRVATIECRVCRWRGRVRRVAGPPQGKPPTVCKDHGLSPLWEPETL
jgi:DNA-directed RNA polymerase subunit K/omega